MTPDDYLREILARESVDNSMKSPLRELEAEVRRLLKPLLSGRRAELYPSGAFEKGTANASGREMDFLLSFPPSTTEHVRDLYETVFAALAAPLYEPARRDVSVAVNLKGVEVDIIPARREAMINDVHELWLARPGRTMKTNLTEHVLGLKSSRHNEEVRVLKIWRDEQGLDFPSFYLELSVLAVLKRRPPAGLAENVWAVLGYFESLFPARSVLDPANAVNVVSDLLPPAEKDAIRKAAKYARAGRAWSEIIW